MRDRLTLIYEFLNRGGQEAERAKRQLEAIGQAAQKASTQVAQAEQIRARVATGALRAGGGSTALLGSGFTATSGTNLSQIRAVETQAKRTAAALQDAGEQGARAGQRTADSFGRGATQLVGLVAAVQGYRRLIQETLVDTTRLAARNETLAIVTEQLARANNLSRDAVFGVAEAIQRQGITTQVSLDSVNKLIFAQIDLAKAADLARLAQDAAVIAGENSSETLDRLIFGITTRQTEVLRRAGINVLFDPEFQRQARQLGRELSEVEKTQIALNLVLAQAPKIAGTYEASLASAEKRLGSLARHVEEAQAAVGERFVPTFSRAVDIMTDFAKAVGDNAGQVAELSRSLAELTTGAGFAGLLRLLGAGGPAAAAGGVIGLGPQHHRSLSRG